MRHIDDDAVSPIIATILMVAVTVVLATTVFVLIDQFSASAPPAPNVIFQVVDHTDRLEVAGASAVADWIRLDARVETQSGAGSIHMGTDAAGGHQNEPAAATGGDILAAPVQVSTQADKIAAGDYLEFCADAPAQHVVVLIVDVASNFKLGPYTFGTIDAC
jgi:flagellin-like protein